MNLNVCIENIIPICDWVSDIIPIRCGVFCRESRKREVDPNCWYGHLVIQCVSEGHGFFECRGKKWKVGSGDIFVFPKREPVIYYNDEPWEYYSIVVAGKITTLFEDSDRLVFPTSKLDLFKEVFERSQAGTLTGIFAAGCVLEILDDVKGFDRISKTPQYVEIAKRCITALPNIKSSDVETISKSVGISSGYLTRLFQESEGCSLKSYITGVFIDRAQVLLETGFSVSEVSKIIGFADQFYFSKAYKKYKGVSPSKVKRRI